MNTDELIACHINILVLYWWTYSSILDKNVLFSRNKKDGFDSSHDKIFDVYRY